MHRLSAILFPALSAILYAILSVVFDFLLFFLKLADLRDDDDVTRVDELRQVGRLTRQRQGISPRRSPGGVQQLRADRQDSTLPQSHSSPGSTRPSPQNPRQHNLSCELKGNFTSVAVPDHSDADQNPDQAKSCELHTWRSWVEALVDLTGAKAGYQPLPGLAGWRQ